MAVFNIPIERLHPHPKNPRKDMGDLTELAASIKENGILQNLTVVEKPNDGFTVIIGHRRLAAAAIAGLKQLPCTIAEMDDPAQIRTMLMENIQRNDLTMYEQAQGFQMMLDMGESVDDIAEASGFSKATVRRRVKLLELDAEKFKKSEERGATLSDYMELDKIKNIDRKNAVLDAIGTKDFRNKLMRALDDEREEENAAEFEQEIGRFARKIDSANEVDGQKVPMRFITSYSYMMQKKEPIEIPEDAGKAKYFYVAGAYSISLYRGLSEEELALDDEHKQEQREERERLENIARQLDAMTNRHSQLRKEFISGFGGAKRYAEMIARQAAVEVCGTGVYGRDEVDAELVSDILGLEITDNDDYHTFLERVKQAGEDRPEFTLLVTVYASMEGSGYDAKYWGWAWDNDHLRQIITHKESAQMDALYDFLEKLGYQESEEERQLRDGNHPIFGMVSSGPETENDENVEDVQE